MTDSQPFAAILPVLVLLIFVPGLAYAGSDYTFSVVVENDGEVDWGEDLIVGIEFTNDGDDVTGVQGGVCCDSDDVSIEDGDVDDTYVGGLDTTFTTVIYYDDENEWVFGILMNVIAPTYLEGDGEVYPFYEATYTVTDDLGEEEDDDGCVSSFEITFCDYGVPLVEVAVVVSGAAASVVEENQEICLLGPPFRFLRGDVNGNGTVTALLDALDLLQWAFATDDAPGCMDAADVDDSGAVSGLLDALFLLNWGFNGGDVPPDPGPTECGTDTTDDDVLDCEVSPDTC